ncbi:MAG: class I SAM-dependent methyltransferase [Oscillospiraceae bacterium]|nr:class I SAM-dependent methyltransferase [Oscillospiraceae bacterium]
MPIIKPCDNVYNKKILDVGCGNGARLIELAADGFLSLYGVDPNIGDDIVSNSSETDNPYIKKSEIFDVNDKYDIIMFNHSLEHMYEHEKVLLHAKSILTDDGYLIIRFPTVSSTAWSKYREHWYALDPPRHVFLHSLKSIEILAKKCGYEITDIISETVSNITLSKLYRIGLDRKQQRKFLKTPRGILMRVLNLPSKFFAPRVGKSDRIRLYLRKSGGTQDGHKL